jgi:hypothetical protein
MLYGMGAKRAYAACDPRKKLEELPADGPIDGDLVAGAIAISAGQLGPGQSLYSHSRGIPAAMRRTQSHRGKQRMKDFDYASLNVSAAALL